MVTITGGESHLKYLGHRLTKFSNYILVLKINPNRLHYLVVFLLILRLKYNLDMYLTEVELRQLPTITQISITNV